MATGSIRSLGALPGLAHALVLFCLSLSVPSIGLLGLDVLALLVFLVEFTRRPIVRRGFLLRLAILACALVTYFVISLEHGFLKSDLALHAVVLALGAYSVGYWAGRVRPGPESLQGLSGLLAAVAGSVAFAVLCVGKGLTAGGHEISQRAAPSIWGAGELINAPALGAYLAFGMCLLPVVVFAPTDPRRRGRYAALALAGLVGAAFYANMALQNRTPFLAAAVAFAGSTVSLIGSSQLRRRSKAIRLGAAAGGLALALVVFPVLDWLPQLTIYARFQTEGLQTARYELWLKVLTEMWQNTDGGRAIHLTESFAHNLWLDVALDAGPLPFVLLAAFHTSHAAPAVRAWRLAPLRARIILLGVGCAILSTAMAEPVMAFPLNYIALHFYYMGVLLGYGMQAPLSTTDPPGQAQA